MPSVSVIHASQLTAEVHHLQMEVTHLRNEVTHLHTEVIHLQELIKSISTQSHCFARRSFS